MTGNAVVTLDCLPAGKQGKFVWKGTGNGRWLHQFSLDGVGTCSKKAIAALNDLMGELKSGSPAGVSETLRELAKRGNDLYRELFNRNSGGFHNAADAQRWLKKLGPMSLTIYTDNGVHIPWGLVYEDDPKDIPANAGSDIAAFNGFWCLRHDVRALHARLMAFDQESVTSETLNWMAVSHSDELSEALKSLPGSEEVDAWHDLCGRLGNSLYSVSDLEDTWRKKSGDFRFVYLFCHGNSRELSFGASESLTSGELSRYLQKDDDRRCPTLVFLNGCETAVGELGSPFLDATAGPGFLGLIGTEAKVPRLFAKRFALAFFLELLKTGLPPGEVMKALRTRHWPFSLVYSVNAVDAISISNPCTSIKIPPSLQRNICESGLV